MISLREASKRTLRGIGLALLAGVLFVTLSTGTRVFPWLSDASAFTETDSLAGNPSLAGRIPSLDGAAEWLNSSPLSLAQLRGKVVLVDFWTYSCINCIRTLPYLRAWAEKYKDQGLVVIGVHAPEFDFEKKTDNVKKAISDFQIDFPVALDNDFRIWQMFRNNSWPAYYFIDATGHIRYRRVGEGGYDQAERIIQELLAEAGNSKAGNSLVAPVARGAMVSPDADNLRSGETYIGYRQASNFVSPEGVKRDAAQDYTTTKQGLNEWGLMGNWTVGAEHATLNRSGGVIAYKFSSRDLHLVLGPGAGGKPVRFQVKIDGHAPGASHGADIDADGNGIVKNTRLYQLVRQAGDVKERIFEIHFHDAGVEAFAFTFG